MVVGKQDTGAVDVLKLTKPESDAESKFNYVSSEDDLMVNKETFDNENSKKSDVLLNDNIKRNIGYQQKTLMTKESVRKWIKSSFV